MNTAINLDAARRLFVQLNQIHLVALDPENARHPRGHDFGRDIGKALVWAAQQNADGFNVYWTVNRTRPRVNKKTRKSDIAAARFAHVDIDPPKDGSPFDAEAVLTALKDCRLPPSFVINSGNGFQAFWRLDRECTDLPGIEAINTQLRDYFGGDDCQNIDRVMRVPGFINYPNAKKRADGRIARLAGWVEGVDGVGHLPEEIRAAFPRTAQVVPETQAVPFIAMSEPPLITPNDLGLPPLSELRSAIEYPPGRDRSGDGLAAARLMAKAGMANEQILGILLNPANAVSAHFIEQRDPRRAAIRAINFVRAKGCGELAMTKSEQLLPQVAAPKPCKLLPFEWAGDAKAILDDLWLIHNWLPKSGTAVVYGHPGAGKSFFMASVAACVARGAPWGGRTVEGGLVIYLVAEGQRAFRNRLFAMQQAGEIAPDAPFALIPTPIDLHAMEGDVDNLIQTIEHLVEVRGVPLALLVIDTLSKTVGAGKENTDDMVAYINNCQRIASTFDCLTAIVHHRPKDSNSLDIRGHSSIRGNIDTAILVEPGKAISLKQKDGEDNIVVRFKLNKVVIGEDRHGNEVTTCLTQIIGDAELTTKPKHHLDESKSRLRGHKRDALRFIEEVVASVGESPPIEIPPDAIDRTRTLAAATIGQIEDRLVGEFLALVSGGEDKKTASAARTSRRCIADLKNAGLLGTWEGWVWVN